MHTANQSVSRFLFPLSYLLIIMFFANESFNFGAFWHVEGVFNVADIGDFMVVFGLVILVATRNGAKRIPRSPLSILIGLYLVMVVVQVVLAALYYGQPMTAGLLGARHQFYYLSYFLFVILLDSEQKIKWFLNACSFLAVMAVVLGLVNYFGSTILTGQFAEGHGIRSGIVRAYVPGMPLISLALTWVLAQWIVHPPKHWLSGLFFLFFMGAHFFRQSRMRIFGALFVFVWSILLVRNAKILIFGVVIGVGAVAVAGVYMQQNIFVENFTSIEEDVEKGDGSWVGRVSQAETAMDEFFKHPIFGSGVSTLRREGMSANTSNNAEWGVLAAKADLGYLHWLKSYGIVGVVWLVFFFGYLVKKSRFIFLKSQYKHTNLKSIAIFSYSSMMFFIVTSVTLNHLMFPFSIVLVSLVAAIIVRTSGILAKAER